MLNLPAPTGITGRDDYLINKAVSIAEEVWKTREMPSEADSDLKIACLLYTAIQHQYVLPEERREADDLQDMIELLVTAYPDYVREKARDW
jgi:hypothetical protein